MLKIQTVADFRTIEARADRPAQPAGYWGFEDEAIIPPGTIRFRQSALFLLLVTAMEFVDKALADGNPFLMFFSTNAAHYPYEVFN